MNTGSFSPEVAQRIAADVAIVGELERLAAGHGLMIMHAQRDWASLTFRGARHSFTWAFDGEEAVWSGLHMAELLAEHEFTVPGRLVADACVTNRDWRLEPPRLVVDFELLVLEED